MAGKTRELLDFLVLLHSPEGATGWPHPVTISIHPRGRTTLLNVSIGPHAANVGGQLPIERVVIGAERNETFAEEFDACEGRWLVPHLAQLAAGENVTAQDLIGTDQSRFGRRPKTERSVDPPLSRMGPRRLGEVIES